MIFQKRRIVNKKEESKTEKFIKPNSLKKINKSTKLFITLLLWTC